MIYLLIYIEFFKTGLFAVGGGLATLPFLYEMAVRRAWFPPERLGDLLAVAQLLPGAIGINLGAYAASFASPAGPVFAPLGLITPQIITILLVSKALDKYKDSPVTDAVFAALKPAACGLLAAAGFLVCRGALFNMEAAGLLAAVRMRECAIFVVILAAVVLLKKHPALYIGLAALTGIALKL
ncbi:MAG: chromate transporter [Spirochaetaceae bacterium]|jgi:chromate transporter|nr:chromate transporter [Spirochaetaceae bacterium]